MPFNSTLITQLVAAGLKTFGSSHDAESDGVIMIDGVVIPENSTDKAVHIGISNTLMIGALFMGFAITGGSCLWKIDTSSTSVTVIDGDQLAVTGMMAAAMLDAISGLTTLNNLKVTTGAGVVCTVSICVVVYP